MAKQFTLGKKERLKSRKDIEQLFKVGKRMVVTPFRIHYTIKNDEQKKGNSLLQFGVGVSGKNFRKAVDRNRIKRLTREAYRLQKLSLQENLKARLPDGQEKNTTLHLFFNYTGKELPVFDHIKEKVAVALDKLSKLINENSTLDS